MQIPADNIYPLYTYIYRHRSFSPPVALVIARALAGVVQHSVRLQDARRARAARLHVQARRRGVVGVVLHELALEARGDVLRAGRGAQPQQRIEVMHVDGWRQG
jgi:hypothetical protein